MSPRLESLLAAAEQQNASDLLLHEGRPALLRISQGWRELEGGDLDAETLTDLWQQVAAPPDAQEHDAALSLPNGDRFRVNCFRQLGLRGAALRRVRREIPELANLGLPEGLLQSWIQRKSGIILICGPTGSGKSTTLAGCLSFLNQTTTLHVVTLEDPVEYIFTDQACRFTQRELGIDTATFAEGLRRSLRQSPDVILIGEIRDADTTLSALQAAETGHLILSTLHVNRAAEIIERLEYLAAEGDRGLLRSLLAGSLIGVVCQRLVPTVDGSTIPALEYFSNAGLVSKLILEGRRKELADVIEKGDGGDALSFNRSLKALVTAGRISTETALGYSPAPEELQRILRGISSGSRG